MGEKITTEPYGSCITLLPELTFSVASKKKWNTKEEKAT